MTNASANATAEGPAQQIIRAIHSLRERPFSITDVARTAGGARTSVLRVLHFFRETGLLIYTERRAYAGRQWHCAASWPDDVNDVIENFMLTKLVRKGA